MKKIINGKLYDTGTAKELGSWDNGLYTNDLNYVCETLYKKRTGELFLLGEGGAATNYSERCGTDNWRGSSFIIPLSFDKAKEWAEKHLDADVYQEIFGAILDDESKTTMCISVSTSTAEKLKRAAVQNKMTVSAYIEKRLQEDD